MKRFHIAQKGAHANEMVACHAVFGCRLKGPDGQPIAHGMFAAAESADQWNTLSTITNSGASVPMTTTSKTLIALAGGASLDDSTVDAIAEAESENQSSQLADDGRPAETAMAMGSYPEGQTAVPQGQWHSIQPMAAQIAAPMTLGYDKYTKYYWEECLGMKPQEYAHQMATIKHEPEALLLKECAAIDADDLREWEDDVGRTFETAMGVPPNGYFAGYNVKNYVKQFGFERTFAVANHMGIEDYAARRRAAKAFTKAFPGVVEKISRAMRETDGSDYDMIHLPDGRDDPAFPAWLQMYRRAELAKTALSVLDTGLVLPK